MAAKQGLTAQLSQAGEDAKRAVLSRTTGVLHKSSWFSNLNTVCTIKSAPPRSPEVLQMLALKSGWLYKRNEQHVWQSRWCCVVPHMFLYYFDADIGQATFARKKYLFFYCSWIDIWNDSNLAFDSTQKIQLKTEKTYRMNT